MKEKLTIIKVGGKIVEETDTLNRLLSDFQLFLAINCWYTVVDVLLPVSLLNWVLKAEW